MSWPAASRAGGRYYFSRQSALTVRQRELVIDRTTALCGAGYEWGVHIATFAEKAGLDAAQVRSLAVGDPVDECWDAADRAVLVCGWYHAVSFTVRAPWLPLEPGTARPDSP